MLAELGYCSRVWIAQEVALAHEARLFCGKCEKDVLDALRAAAFLKFRQSNNISEILAFCQGLESAAQT